MHSQKYALYLFLNIYIYILLYRSLVCNGAKKRKKYEGFNMLPGCKLEKFIEAAVLLHYFGF